MRLEELNTFSICVRLLLAVVFGGIIGLDRGKKNRAAGLRTHMLVCIGACLTMLTNEYIGITLHMGGDPTRMAAQVISGVGFLGAGSILVTGKYQIKGLTTAAGLWASACLGLAVGIGFYEGAALGFLFILCTIVSFKRVDSFFNRYRKIAELYVELEDINGIRELLTYFRCCDYTINDLEVIKSMSIGKDSIGLIIILSYPHKRDAEEILSRLREQKGVIFAEKLG